MTSLQVFNELTQRKGWTANLRRDFLALVLEEVAAEVMLTHLESLVKRARPTRRVTDPKLVEPTWNARSEKYMDGYLGDLREAFKSMEHEVLSNVRRQRGYRPTVKTTFDVDAWLFNRQKWRTTFSDITRRMDGATTHYMGQHFLDDIGLGVSFNVIDRNILRWVAENSKAAGWNIADTTYDDLRQQLLEAIAEGESVPKIAARVMGVFGDISEYRSVLIARTETLKASNYGLYEGMRQSNVIEGRMWMATADERTCPQCQDMDGITMPLDRPFFDQGAEHTWSNGSQSLFDYEDIIQPPLHPGCRCTTTAIIKEAPARLLDKDVDVRGHVGDIFANKTAAVDLMQRDHYRFTGQTLRDREARVMYEAVREFTGSYTDIFRAQMGFRDFFDSEAQYLAALKKGDRLEKLLGFAPKFDQPIFRGLQGQRFGSISEQFVEELRKLKVGDMLKFNSTQHWTSDLETAEGFDGDIVFRIAKPTKGMASIKHMSEFADENEVMVSRSKQFRITKIGESMNQWTQKKRLVLDLEVVE